MTRPRPIVALLLWAGLVTAACGAQPAAPSAGTGRSPVPRASASGSARPSGGSGPSSAARLDACALVTPAVAAEFSGDAMGPPQASDRDESATCVYGSAHGGPATVGATVGYATADSSAIDRLATQMPDASPAPGLDHVLVAPGAAWFLVDRHLVSIVLVDAGGAPGSPARMRDLVRLVLARV